MIVRLCCPGILGIGIAIPSIGLVERGLIGLVVLGMDRAARNAGPGILGTGLGIPGIGAHGFVLEQRTKQPQAQGHIIGFGFQNKLDPVFDGFRQRLGQPTVVD